ncbi:hypothetical protein H6795_00640 [Candidatus Nomurabacteria bacterium]|nr:hypothetical protein [Candidatus Nomurabacteria bacterium]
MSALRKLFTDKNGHIVIAQFPNIPILVWFGAVVATSISTSSTADTVLSTIGTVALASWAFLELVSGVNYFRRSLGLIVLIFLIISKISQ